MTNAFLEQARNNLENLSDTKVLYVIKGCLENLARAKSALRAQKLKKSIFGATYLCPPSHLPHDDEVKPNLQMASKESETCAIFLCKLKHDAKTKATRSYGAAEICGQKFLTSLSNLLNFGCSTQAIFIKAVYC